MNVLLLPLFAAIEVMTTAGSTATAVTWNTIVLAFINIIGIGITSFVALKIAQINTNSVKAVENTQSTKVTSEATAKKTEEIGQKVVEIHTATNGNLSKLEAALGVSAEKLEGMQKLVSEMMSSSREKDATLARVRYDKDSGPSSGRNTAEIVKESVKEAVIESVKAPVKEAVLETRFTKEQIEQIVKALSSV